MRTAKAPLLVKQLEDFSLSFRLFADSSTTGTANTICSIGRGKWVRGCDDDDKLFSNYSLEGESHGYFVNTKNQGQTGRQAGRQTGRQADRQTGRQTDRQADRQTDRQTDRQAGRQTDGQAD